MRAVVPGRAWGEQPDRCVLMMNNARIHDGVALASVRAAGVVVLLFPPYSPDFNPIEDVFSVGSSWLRWYSSTEEYNAWPMLTIKSMLEHISGAMCRGCAKAAVRLYNVYIP